MSEGSQDPGRAMLKVVPFSFYKIWGTASGVYMMAGRCPFCGGQGCVAGVGAALIVGGAIAGIAYGSGAISKVVSDKKVPEHRNGSLDKNSNGGPIRFGSGMIRENSDA